MATIKDVAKLAGVSIGTVSNVINHINTVSIENAKKVNSAIKELGYSPRSTARDLKASNSKLISIIFPNITDEIYALSYSYLSDLLSAKGLETELHITHDILVNEKEILKSAVSHKPIAIIIATCQPHNEKLFQSIMSQGINLIFYNRNTEFRASYIGFDNKKCVKKIVDHYLSKSISNICLLCGPDQFSTEHECIEGYKESFTEHSIHVDPNNIQSIDYTLPSAYRSCSKLLSNTPAPDVIISTSSVITNGLLKALQLSVSGSGPQLEIFVNTELNSLPSTCHFAVRPIFEACKTIADALLKDMNNAPFYDFRDIRLKYQSYNMLDNMKQMPNAAYIRILALKGDISESMISLIPYAEKILNTKILLDAVKYEDLYQNILNHKDDDYYDIYTFDLPWLHDLSENHYLKDISSYITDDVFSEVAFEPSIFDTFSKHKGKIFALPFMHTNQLLFYRKDLFDDYQNKLLFKKMYHADLAAPKTWSEFNAIASFFTQKYNENSQTLYGTTLSGQFSSAVYVEYLTRLWASQDSIFDSEGMPMFDTPNAVNALENYMQSYQYAAPNSIDNWWYEQVNTFASGSAAMMIMYSSHVAPIVDSRTSKVLGKVGYAPVPGKKHTLGGWSVGINENSKNEETVLAYLKMLCSREMAIPLTLQGCFSANSITFTSNIISDLYPWISYGLQLLPESRSRELPERYQHLQYKQIEMIVAKYVRKCILENADPHEMLKQANSEIKDYFNQKG